MNLQGGSELIKRGNSRSNLYGVSKICLVLMLVIGGVSSATGCIEPTRVSAASSNAEGFLDTVGHDDEPHIRKLAEMGVVDGYGGGVFGPEDSVTREQFAKLLVLSVGIDVSGAITGLDFADNFQISNWAKPYVAVAVEKGLIAGLGNNMFAPRANVTRAQALTMIARVFMGDEALTAMAGANSPTGFADDWLIPGWARPAVNYALNREIVSIRDFRNLAPDQYSSRAMCCRFLSRLVDAKDMFTDPVAETPIVPVPETPIELVPDTPVVPVPETQVLPTGVRLSTSTLSLMVDDTAQLSATVEPRDAVNQEISWESSDLNVANVGPSGSVTATGAGSAIITAETSNGITAICRVVVKYESPLPSESYNVISSSNRLYFNAYSTASKVFPYGLVTAAPDDSPEQTVVTVKQPDGSYLMKVMRNKGMYAYVKDGISPGSALYVDSSSKTAFVIRKYSSGEYIIACRDNPDLVLTSTSSKPYNTLAHYYVKLATYTGATTQRWMFNEISSQAAIPTLLTFPIDVRDAATKDNTGAVDVSALYAITYGGKVSYYRSGGEDYTGGHYGTDYCAVDISFGGCAGKPVVAIADGTVVRVRGSHGTVYIKHVVPLTLFDSSRTYHTWYSVYSHLSNIRVKTGQSVSQGSSVGSIGKTGVDAYHLHFSVTTRLYNGNDGFTYAFSYSGAKDAKTLKEYSNAALSPYWLAGSFRNVPYKAYSDDIADASAIKRILRGTESAPPSN